MKNTLRYSLKSVMKQPVRTLFTIGSGSLCATLMLFLLSVYRGVEVGSMTYINRNSADLWVLQDGVTNIMRGSSVLFSTMGEKLKKIDGVDTVEPVLYVLGQARANGHTSTIEIAGYLAPDKRGGPPGIVSGRRVKQSGEIVLDRSFAAKCKVRIGDYVTIHKENLKVVGISSGTNMFVIQYAFTTLAQAQEILGYPGIVSCYLVSVSKSNDIDSVVTRIKKTIPEIEVYTQGEFTRNNLNEMRAGFLPILWIIAFISAFVLGTILTAILTMNITENRRSFAVMMALGSPSNFLPRFITGQALVLSLCGSLSTLVFFFPLMTILGSLFPELTTETNLQQIILVQAISIAVGYISAIISIRRIRKIYPSEAFT